MAINCSVFVLLNWLKVNSKNNFLRRWRMIVIHESREFQPSWYCTWRRCWTIQTTNRRWSTTVSYFCRISCRYSVPYWHTLTGANTSECRTTQTGLPFTETLPSRCYLPYLRFQNRGTAVDGVRHRQSHPHRSFDGIKFHAERPKVRFLKDLMIWSFGFDTIHGVGESEHSFFQKFYSCSFLFLRN